MCEYGRSMCENVGFREHAVSNAFRILRAGEWGKLLFHEQISGCCWLSRPFLYHELAYVVCAIQTIDCSLALPSTSAPFHSWCWHVTRAKNINETRNTIDRKHYFARDYVWSGKFRTVKGFANWHTRHKGKCSTSDISNRGIPQKDFQIP